MIDDFHRAAVMLRQGVSAREVGRFLGRSHTWVNYKRDWLLSLLQPPPKHTRRPRHVVAK